MSNKKSRQARKFKFKEARRKSSGSISMEDWRLIFVLGAAAFSSKEWYIDSGGFISHDF
jgi:hypothetical protein